MVDDSAGQELSIDADLERLTTRPGFRPLYRPLRLPEPQQRLGRAVHTTGNRDRHSGRRKPTMPNRSGKKSRFEAGPDQRCGDRQRRAVLQHHQRRGRGGHRQDESLRVRGDDPGGLCQRHDGFGKDRPATRSAREQTIAKGHQQVNNSTFTRDYTQLFPTAFLTLASTTRTRQHRFVWAPHRPAGVSATQSVQVLPGSLYLPGRQPAPATATDERV